MAKDKVTISLDRDKVNRARALIQVRSTSEAIDVALDRLIEAEYLRQDLEAYQNVPPTVEETAVAALPMPSLDEDGIDWESLYPEFKQ